MIGANAPLAVQGTKAVAQFWRRYGLEESMRLNAAVGQVVAQFIAVSRLVVDQARFFRQVDDGTVEDAFDVTLRRIHGGQPDADLFIPDIPKINNSASTTAF